ncbi:hypothetical protein C8A05DRAFT_39580 [Staphylotrichum tortipilum]|uniref:BZIP domain-containing protein n=1 Tax=Staphylotrichum tortipilum TaxID=2831512 RepID=A0AAN6M916_9PEZI|nr:hypothetical protein C8A05DRAFT_39580 [Staphylotrichum longicolle]
MSSYGGPRRVNVSQYLRNLNVQGPSVEETFTDEDLEKDLALFTNTQFFDFETGQHTDYQAAPVKPESATTQSPGEDVSPADSILGDFSSAYDFPISGDFSFGDYSSTFTSPTIPAFPDALGSLQPIQPNPQSAYPSPVHPHQHAQHSQHPHAQHAQHPQQHQPNGYVALPPRAAAGEKRKAEAMTDNSSTNGSSSHPLPPNGHVMNFEDSSRVAAEEDKRKRNTAASARFRIKKKQREQALEKSAKEMTEKVTMLEGRISALETENKWLKSLVTEKHGGRDDILEKLLKEVAGGEGGKGEVRDSITAAGEKSKRRD